MERSHYVFLPGECCIGIEREEVNIGKGRIEKERPKRKTTRCWEKQRSPNKTCRGTQCQDKDKEFRDRRMRSHDLVQSHLGDPLWPCVLGRCLEGFPECAYPVPFCPYTVCFLLSHVTCNNVHCLGKPCQRQKRIWSQTHTKPQFSDGEPLVFNKSPLWLYVS